MTSKQDRTPAQQHKSKKMHQEMHDHIANDREKGSMHPASIKPQTNLPIKPQQPQTSLTGPGARNAVLRNGIRPTGHQDLMINKQSSLKEIAIKLKELDRSMLSETGERDRFRGVNPRLEKFTNVNIEKANLDKNKILLYIGTLSRGDQEIFYSEYKKNPDQKVSSSSVQQLSGGGRSLH